MREGACLRVAVNALLDTLTLSRYHETNRYLKEPCLLHDGFVNGSLMNPGAMQHQPHG